MQGKKQYKIIKTKYYPLHERSLTRALYLFKPVE